MDFDYTKMTLRGFLEALSAETPAPAGASTCAIVGALAAGLSVMCASYAIGREKYADVQDEVLAIREKAQALRDKCMELAVEDSVVYAQVAEARKLPGGTPEEDHTRRSRVDITLRQATDLPFEIAEQIKQIIPLADRLAEIGNPTVKADARAASELAAAAVRGCIEQIRDNLSHISDESYSRSAKERLNRIS